MKLSLILLFISLLFGLGCTGRNGEGLEEKLTDKFAQFLVSESVTLRSCSDSSLCPNLESH